MLDLAAGTGKLTRALLAAGLDVVAVEPQAPLREILAASIGAERVREGTAEAIPLPDGSVAAVTVADAMHWFDHAAALAEIRRVLRPGGGLAVLTTVPDWGSASWAHEVGSLIGDLRPQHPHFDGPPWQDALAAADGWGSGARDSRDQPRSRCRPSASSTTSHRSAGSRRCPDGAAQRSSRRSPRWSRPETHRASCPCTSSSASPLRAERQSTIGREPAVAP